MDCGLLQFFMCVQLFVSKGSTLLLVRSQHEFYQLQCRWRWHVDTLYWWWMGSLNVCCQHKSIDAWMLCLVGWTLEVGLGCDLDLLICRVWICRNWIVDWCQVCLGWIWEDFQQHSEPPRWEMNHGQNKRGCLFLTNVIGEYGLLFIAILRECLSFVLKGSTLLLLIVKIFVRERIMCSSFELPKMLSRP